MTSQRRLLTHLALTAAVLFPTDAISLAQTPDVKPRATASVAGRVMIGDKPAPGIIVAVNGINQQALLAQATSDTDGKYRINGLAPGQVTISTFTPTFVLPQSPTFTPGRTLNLSADEVIEGIDFKLTRGGVITGRVTDGEGKPVVEERISLNQLDDGRGPTQAIPGRPIFSRGANPYMYSTDDRGVYRIYGVPAGRYLVSAGDDAGGMGTVRGAGYYQRTYSPDTTDASKAAIVEVSEGGEAKNVDINLGLRAHTYTVSGHVVDADSGQPLAGVDYSFGALRQEQNQTYFSGSYSPGTPTNASGEFRIEGLEPGRYGITASASNPFVPNNYLSASDQQPRMYSDPVQFEIIDSDVSGLEIKARRALSVSGTVITDGITNKRALAIMPRLMVSGFAQPSANSIQTYGGVVASPIAADGSFQLDGLRPGKVSLNVGGMSASESRGITVSRIVYERELPNGQLDLPPGQNVSGVRIYLAYGTGIIKGEVKVEGGTLPPDAFLMVALHRENQTVRPGSAQVDARGRFIITGIPAGTYDALLQVISFGQATPLPRGFQRSQRQQVTVSDDSELQITFTIDLTPKEGP